MNKNIIFKVKFIYYYIYLFTYINKQATDQKKRGKTFPDPAGVHTEKAREPEVS